MSFMLIRRPFLDSPSGSVEEGVYCEGEIINFADTTGQLKAALRKLPLAAGSKYKYPADIQDCEAAQVTALDLGYTDGAQNLWAYTTTSYAGLEKYTAVTRIGQYMFYRMRHNANPILPPNVVTIDAHAFELAYFDDGWSLDFSRLTAIGSRAFYTTDDNPFDGEAAGDCVLTSVESLGEYAFYGRQFVNRNLTLPSTEALTAIPDYCFYDCRFSNPDAGGVLNIPTNITEIGASAFVNCRFKGFNGYTLGDYNTIPASVATIKANAFKGNATLEGNLVVPATVTSMGSGCFSETGITELSIKNTAVPSLAFSGCPNLQTITVDATTATIAANAFSNCPAITKITLGSNTDSIAGAPWGAPSTAEIVWADSNTGMYCTGNIIDFGTETRLKTNLRTLPLPEGKEYKYESDIQDCEAAQVTAIDFGYTLVANNDWGVGVRTLSTLSYYNNVKSIGVCAFARVGTNYALDPSPAIPSSVELVGASAFAGAKFINGWIIDFSHLINIGTRAFSATAKNMGTAGCDCLLSDSLKALGQGAFLERDFSGRSLRLPNNPALTALPDSAFLNCHFSNPDSNGVLDIPSNIKTIGNLAFMGNGFKGFTGYTSGGLNTLPANVTTLGNYAFYQTPIEGHLVIPETVVSMGTYCFGNCNFTEVSVFAKLPNGSIPEGAFAYGSLTAAHFCENIVNIGASCFVNCALLTDVSEWVGQIKTFGRSAFKASGVTELKGFNETLTTIPSSFAENCSALTRVELPASVTSIDATAFQNDFALTDIYVDKPANSIAGAPWGATNATVYWSD